MALSSEPHVNTQILASADDGREDGGAMDITNTELFIRGATDRYVGLRFKLNYSQGQAVPAAVVQFTCHTTGASSQDDVRICGQRS